MKTVAPFLPTWIAKIGPLTESGSGLISKNLRTQKDLLDEFKVILNNFVIIAQPKLGILQLNSKVAAKLNTSCKLLWFRRTHVNIHTHDTNANCTPDCLWYGIGFEYDGKKFGYKLFADNKIVSVNF